MPYDILKVVIYENSRGYYTKRGGVTMITERVENAAAADVMNGAGPGRQRKKLPLIFIIAGIVIVAVITVLFHQKEAEPVAFDFQPATIPAYIAADGTGYIPLYDGKSIIINEDVNFAFLAEDGQRLFVLLKDGTFYVTNPEQTNRTVIADNVVADEMYDVWIRDDGFIYKGENGSLYKVLLPQCESIEIGKVEEFITADNTVSLLYTTRDGAIYTMAANSKESVKVGEVANMAVHIEDGGLMIGEFDTVVNLLEVSDDCQTFAWTETNNDTKMIYFSEGDNRSTIEAKRDYLYNQTFTTDLELAVVSGTGLWIKKAGEEPFEVKLPGEVNGWNIYTEDGFFFSEKATDVESFYVDTRGESYNNLYNVTLDGDCERVLSKIKTYFIRDGYIVYLDSENNLYCGELNGSEVLEKKKIDSEVGEYEVTDKGDYVYYVKGEPIFGETVSLYCYKIGTDKPVKVKSELPYYDLGFFGNICSMDGATLYYLEDAEKIEGTYLDYGTLMKWSYGDESATKVASDVLRYSPVSGSPFGGVVNNKFWYLKYTHSDSEGNIITDLMYHNGEDSQKIATEITTKSWYY